MKLKEKLADDYAKEQLKIRPIQPFEDYYKTTRAHEAGFEKAREMAAIRGRLAQLESKVVDVEIEKLGEEEVS